MITLTEITLSGFHSTCDGCDWKFASYRSNSANAKKNIRDCWAEITVTLDPVYINDTMPLGGGVNDFVITEKSVKII